MDKNIHKKNIPYRLVSKNLSCHQGRYYLNVGKKYARRIYATTDKEAIALAVPMCHNINIDRLEHRLAKLKARQARELVKLELKLRKMWNLG